MSKRKLLQLVQDGHVRGWDDPRMPTLSGIRRRGYTPEALRNFCARIGVSKTNGIIELGLLEHHVREDLNKRAPRVMAVLRPLRVVIDNYPEGQVEELEAVNNPEDAAAGTRKVPFSQVLYIEQDDFREDPPKQYFPPVAGQGSAAALRLLHHLHQRGEGRKRRSGRDPLHLRPGHARRQRARRPQSEIHHPLGLGRARRRRRSAALRQPVHQAKIPTRPTKGEDFTANLNPDSLEVLTGASWSRRWRDAVQGGRFQFERLGYFCVDPDSAPGKPVFNRTVALSDTWAKIEKAEKAARNRNDHSRNRRHSGRCAPRHSERRRILRAAWKNRNWAGGTQARRAQGADGAAGASIATCLELAGATPEQVDAVAIVRPIPAGPEAAPPASCARSFRNSRIVVVEHHLAHAASAYYPSPFDEATVLTLDRGGDFRCGSRWRGEGTEMTLEQEQYYPDSLGDLYGRVTELLGFRANETNTKCSGFRSAGDDRYRDLFLEILTSRWRRPASRPFVLRRRAAALTAASARVLRAARAGRRRGDSGSRARARSRPASRRPWKTRSSAWPATGTQSLPGRRLGVERAAGFRAGTRSGFENVFVQPAAGNAGTAIGAVLNTWHTVYRQERSASAAIRSAWARLTPPPRSNRCSKTASCASAIC